MGTMPLERPVLPRGRMVRLLRGTGAVLLVAGLLALVPASPGGADEVTISITSRLDPRDATVSPGTTVTWVNDDVERHRVRATSGAGFDSGNLAPGDRFSFTFSAEGRTQYLDDRDRAASAYHGSVTVVGSAPPTSSPPATGPGAGAGAGAASPPPSAADVTIGDRIFTPASVVVAPGATVTWTNRDDRAHTATADGGAFDTGSLAAGASSAKTFPAEGTFSYVCELHPDMTGVVRVSAASGTAPPPPPPPPTPPPSAGTPPPAAPAASAAPPTRSGPPATAAGPAVRRVSMTDFAFAPAVVEARVGDTIDWVNTGRAPHTATATTGAFDSGRVASAGTFRFSTGAVGTITYGCTFHPDMTGTLVVTSASAPAPRVVRPDTTAPTTTTAAAAPAAPTAPAAERPAITAPLTATVEATDFAFAPATVEVAVGGTVTWQLTGKAPHSITAADGSAFDSGLLSSGESFSHTFEGIGSFAYGCVVHPDMTGTIEVVDAASASSSARPATDAASPISAAGPPDPAGSTQAWTVALVGGAAILGATGLLLGGARRFLLASEA